MMKILILGITGRTGSLAAAEAIKRGHKVVGVARNPDKVTVKDAEIVGGTPYDFETVRKAIIGCDAVIATLSLLSQSQGILGKINTPLDVLSVSMKNTVRAMEENGIKRIVLMTALGTGDSAKELPGIARLLIKLTNIRYSYADHEIEEKVIENSDLDWTIVRPVSLNDKNDNLSILFNLKGAGKIKNTISRNAVAHFILDCIEKGEFIRQKPGISNG
jgi:putative NADH-flavin reductase